MNKTNYQHQIGFIPTLNKMGYTVKELDYFTQKFLNNSFSNSKGHYLDIGAAFGYFSLPLAEKGINITACDCEKKHIEVIKNKAKTQNISIKLIQGHLPGSLDFPENSFDSILMAMVIHFLKPEEIEEAIKKLLSWLKPQGKLFVTTSTPYQKNLKNFLPVFEKRLKENHLYPGLIDNLAIYSPKRAEDLPKHNIVYTAETLSKLFKDVPCEIEEAQYFTRECIPEDIHFDGREYVGLIIKKV